MAQSQKRLTWKQVGLGLLGLFLFVLALGYMKEGAGSLAPLLSNNLRVTHALDSLGFGWLMGYAILSGSPAAAAGVALLSAGALTPAQTFTLITGSRLGASLMVLLTGLIYSLRGHERRTALSAGVLSLLLTVSIQVIAVPLGLLILNLGWFDHLDLPLLEGLAAGVGLGINPLIAPLAELLPGWLLFVIGVILAIAGFRLFDMALPQLKLNKTDLGQISRLIYRPEVMFLMGLVITFFTLSVSVSVGILVPLSARGYVRRENIIPYILGASVSTLIDTLIAAMLLGDPAGVTVVVVHMVCAATISLLIIVLAYRPYERAISRALSWITRSRTHFVLFMSLILVVPIVLILL